MKNTFNNHRFFTDSFIALALFITMPAAYALADGPIITAPSDITEEAASSTGAVVSFSVSAVDASSTPVIVSCAPTSGSLFAIATTTVSCEASDGIATSTATFNVSVVDTTPPSITAPVDQTFTATGTSTTPTLVEATSTDLADPNPAITYNPTSFSVGTTTVTWTATDANGNVATTTSNVFITEAPQQATLAIRDGSTLVGPFTVTLPDVGAPSVLIAPTSATTTYAVPARSVLAILSSLDALHGEFDITDLQYFSSFNSFLVNCMSVPAASASPDCFNWTYAVNGSFPFFGMDVYTLQDGDAAYVFFGSQLQVSADKASVVTNESFAATAQKYDPSAGIYVPAQGETVGAVQFDSNFNAIEFATSTTDANGHATLSIAEVGDYSVGILSGGYFPNTPIIVSAQPLAASGGSVMTAITHHDVDIDKAIQFLSTKQKPDGSFGAGLYTDWAAIALAAGPSDYAKDKAAAYLKSAPNTGVSVTDYERRAMALMSFGINPYSGTDTNYIKKITDSFDGAQIGDSSLVNDDIFAVFPLIKSGYAENDPMMQKIAAFIISKQRGDGSWENSIDMTAAAIQSLALFPSAPGISDARTKAKNYLLASQQNNGCFGSGGSFSASWAIQAISALSESPSNWQKNNSTPGDCLYSFQRSDGGIEPESSDENTRIWATSYAIPAALGRTWSSILSYFARPITAELNGGGGLSAGATATTTTSSTLSLLPQDNGNATTTGTSTIQAPSSTSPIVLLTATTTEPATTTQIIPPLVLEPAPSGIKPQKLNSASVLAVKNDASSAAKASSVDDLAPPSGSGAVSNLASVGPSGVEGLKNIGTAIIHGVSSFVGGIISFFWRW